MYIKMLTSKVVLSCHMKSGGFNSIGVLPIQKTGSALIYKSNDSDKILVIILEFYIGQI